MLGVSAQLGGRHMVGSLGAVPVLRLTAHINGSLAVKVFLQNRGQSLALFTLVGRQEKLSAIKHTGAHRIKRNQLIFVPWNFNFYHLLIAFKNRAHRESLLVDTILLYLEKNDEKIVLSLPQGFFSL